MTQKYWHELSLLDRSKEKQRLKTDQAIQAEYLAPKWCSLGQDALLYMDGCWSLLLDENSITEQFCSCLSTEEGIATCHFYKGTKQNEL